MGVLKFALGVIVFFALYAAAEWLGANAPAWLGPFALIAVVWGGIRAIWFLIVGR